ncbi:hypothetical protein GLAREA_03796 [Glarea lozoyensis ATCC 20868]|uniref:Uncharacterized protein n=1 Tax=Glarea lozoyensis (strain ATCC 20868 / MF5171) TaxID=1116229 RepID=S3D110_GLAL2|nr:uncharacterized protein GLAREA_03796 [Glarea lozoyensis ATCC 20868]EPE30829.1 hypothetical protein GLAREA_03796 [Glarea lozoyensis ATCC 20868]
MSSYQTSKPRKKVKPILKKLTQSEKNSLDLDRPSGEQDGFSAGTGLFEYNYGTASRGSHDVVFQGRGQQHRVGHTRSTSGTSQFSTATAGSFVHPFQQTPRPYTPPLVASYQNSVRDSEISNHSPAFTEDEADHGRLNYTLRPSNTGTSSSLQHPQLRLQTKQSSSRLALATSTSSLSHTGQLSAEYTSPVDTMSPSSLRTSMDKGFRLRSRSEVDGRGRHETIAEERRKFHEREQAKEEKAARDEVKAIERRNYKEAREQERRHRRSSASEDIRSKRSKSDLTLRTEKSGNTVGRDYDSIPTQNTPSIVANLEDGPRRVHKESAKKKTYSAWQKFMIWLRTRFIRVSNKKL